MESIKNISRDLWTGGKIFKLNPKKVAGEVTEVSGRFGNIEVVKGTVEDVKRILPPPSKKYDNWLVSIDNQKPEKQKKSKLEKAIQATKHNLEHPVPAGIESLSFSEIRRKFAAHISDSEYRVWTSYQKSRQFDLTAISKKSNGWNKYSIDITDLEYLNFHDKGIVAHDGLEWIPSPIYYSGNVYNKIAELDRNKSKTVNVIGLTRFDNQKNKLKGITPDKLRLSRVESERLVIKPLDPFIKKVNVSELSDGTIFDEDKKVLIAFLHWLKSLPKGDFENGSNYYNILNYEIRFERFPNDTAASKKAEIKRNAQKDLTRLYSKFLAEMLTSEDQSRIEVLWNIEYNGFVEMDFQKIPVGFEINKYFKTGLIDPRPALWDGVRFMAANGSGVIAFDVGVGKTMTAILAVAQAMYTGQCKRPVIVVPNPTYYKWISECIGEYNEDGTVKVHGVLPQFKDRINDYNNLGVKHIQKAIDTPPEDYTITFLTFEGLNNLGLSGNLQEEIGREMVNIIGQGLSDRDTEKMREKIDSFMGDATSNTSVNFDDLGFDYLVLDEAHNAKKIFTSVKGEVEDEGGTRQRSPYAIQAGKPSNLGIKTFLLSQYIMRRNNMRNVCLLTATPFTNSPLEIYSMLALVAYQKLKDRGIENIKAFFDKFVMETSEQVITSRGRFEEKPVIKGFNNRKVLQNIIFTYMIHKTGDEANVPRPIKVVYPRLKGEDGIILPLSEQVDTALPQTPDQKYWMREIAAMANKEPNAVEEFMGANYYDPDTGDLMGRDLLAVSLGRQVTISPYLLRTNDGDKNYNYFLGNPNPTGKQIVDSSPKLQYAVGCIKTIKAHHEARKEEVSSVVLYINGGVDYFTKIAEYIESELNFTSKQVATLGGGTSNAKKESVKKRFLSGEIKVLIGSSTIREGIDLQNKSTTLFNLTLDWNPTDIQQLEGRIWRQGNQHSHVRIVTPLVENSVDVFMFQKLEEKTSRINSIWYRAGRTNVLDVDNFDPKELKLGLMTDPTERARVVIKNQAKTIDSKIEVIDEYINELTESKVLIESTEKLNNDVQSYLNKSIEGLNLELLTIEKRLSIDSYERKAEMDKDTRTKLSISTLLSKKEDPQARIAIVKKFAKIEIANSGRWTSNYSTYERIRSAEKLDKDTKRLDRLQKNVLDQHALKLSDNLDPLIGTYESDKVKLTDSKAEIESKDSFDKLIKQYEDERSAADKKSMSVAERVKQFTKHNHLLSCLKDVHSCGIDDGKTAKAPPKKANPPKPTSTIEIRIDALETAYSITKDQSIKTRVEALKIALDLAA